MLINSIVVIMCQLYWKVGTFMSSLITSDALLVTGSNDYNTFDQMSMWTSCCSTLT